MELLKSPQSAGPHLELVRHQPASDPKLKGLEEAGRKQREQVHRLLRNKAYEPLATVGPEVYTHILGEKVTGERVHVAGTTEAQQGARTGQNLLDFYQQGAPKDATVLKPSEPPKPASQAKKPTGQRSKPYGKR